MGNPSPDVVEAGTVLAGRYRVERQLGKGGMGSVYLVEHVHTEQRLALKLLHATVVSDEVALARFRREARAPARIDSDHVVKVTDADVAPELGGVPFLVMEWLRGRSLEELVTERGVLPPEEAVLYLRHAARALDKAHALGVIHRDIKPENLFVTTREDGTPCVKLLDFGIAKLTQGGDEGRLKATGTGQIFGTPLYMSPEQTKAEADKIGTRSDIWALGVLAHRLLLGREPWTATTLTGLIGQIAYEPLPVPSKAGSRLGAAFDAWFAHCCAREPDDRFPAAGEAVSALARALGLREDGAASAPASSASSPSSIQAPPSMEALPPTRPSREEGDRTAFSATAPAPLPSVAHPASTTPAPKSRSLALPLFAVAVGISAAIASGIYVSRRQADPHPVPSSLAVGPALPPASATAIAVPPSETAPAAAPIAVTPAASAPPPSTEPPPVPSLASQRHGHPPPAPPPLPPKTAAAAPPPAPTPPPPPKPEDPLGTRH